MESNQPKICIHDPSHNPKRTICGNAPGQAPQMVRWYVTRAFGIEQPELVQAKVDEMIASYTNEQLMV